MDGNALKNLVTNGATILATALGGPLAGTAVGAIAKALGVEPDTSAVEAKLISGALTPEQALALQSADLEFKRLCISTISHDTEVATTATVEDRKSARDLQVATRSLTVHYLSFLITLGFFAVLGMMAFGPTLNASTKSSLDIMLGGLGAGFTAVISYWFGSSFSSSKKDDLLANR